MLEEPILELRALGEFVEGVLRGERERGSASVDTILNPDIAAAQASSSSTTGGNGSGSGDVRMEEEDESAAGVGEGMGSSAFVDLSRAAGLLVPGLKGMESQSPGHETESIDLDGVGSPSYSPPASPSPSLSFETLLKRTDIPATTPSSILSKPTPTIYHAPNDPHKRTTFPPSPSEGIPTWKLDLHARHPLRLLHAGGPRQLTILTRCHDLVQAATRKAEACVRRIEELKTLSKEMKGEREQWVEFCEDLEGNVMLDYGDGEDGDGKGVGDGDRDEVARQYGRLDDRDGVGAWGYRKFENPTTQRRQRLASIYENEDDENNEDAETDIAEDSKRLRRAPVHHHHHHRSGSGSQPRSKRTQGSESLSSTISSENDDDSDDTCAGIGKQQKVGNSRSGSRYFDRNNRKRPGREVKIADADPYPYPGFGGGHGEGMQTLQHNIDAEDADADEEWESTDSSMDSSTETETDDEQKKHDGKKGRGGMKKEKGLKSAGGGVVGLYGEVV